MAYRPPLSHKQSSYPMDTGGSFTRGKVARA